MPIMYSVKYPMFIVATHVNDHVLFVCTYGRWLYTTQISHKQQQDTTAPCNHWTNKGACISEVPYKRHQLKAWFIISLMPLLPIKCREGEKKPFAAGRQQTDKNQYGSSFLSKKPPVSTVHYISSQACGKTYQRLPSSIDITYILFTADKDMEEVLYHFYYCFTD